MRIISGTAEFELTENTAVTIGKFDGIHRGHRKILEQVLRARKDGMKAVVFTFDPSPGDFFSGSPQKVLTTREEKRQIFAKMGFDILVEFPMNGQTASIPAEEFVRRILCEKMHTRFLAAGTDLSFGDRGLGDWQLLRRLSGMLGYRVRVTDKLLYEGREISSTFIKEEIAAGNLERAADMLGAPYRVGGEVSHGKRLGRTFGMPTVNLLPPPDKLLPPNGVCFSETELEGKKIHGITNIGCRPTVSNSGQMSVETYLYDFHQEIYGAFVEVSLHAFRRPERKFSGVEELKAHMAQDIAAGRAYWRLQEPGRESPSDGDTE